MVRSPLSCQRMSNVSPGCFPLMSTSRGLTATASARLPSATETRAMGDGLSRTSDFPTVTVHFVAAAVCAVAAGESGPEPPWPPNAVRNGRKAAGRRTKRIVRSIYRPSPRLLKLVSLLVVPIMISMWNGAGRRRRRVLGGVRNGRGRARPRLLRRRMLRRLRRNAPEQSGQSRSRRNRHLAIHRIAQHQLDRRSGWLPRRAFRRRRAIPAK